MHDLSKARQEAWDAGLENLSHMIETRINALCVNCGEHLFPNRRSILIPDPHKLGLVGGTIQSHLKYVSSNFCKKCQADTSVSVTKETFHKYVSAVTG